MSENVVTAVLADLSHRWAPLPGIQGYEPQRCADCQRVSYSEMDRAINGTQCPQRALTAVYRYREALSELLAEGDAITAAPDEYTASLAFDRMDVAITRARALLAGDGDQ